MSYFIKILDNVETLLLTVTTNTETQQQIKKVLKKLDQQEKKRIMKYLKTEEQVFKKEMKQLDKFIKEVEDENNNIRKWTKSKNK